VLFRTSFVHLGEKEYGFQYQVCIKKEYLMELRTIVKADPSSCKIGYDTGVMLIGSCFATAIGMKMGEGKLPVMINPSGTLFNPVSVSDTLDIITGKKYFGIEDLHNHDGVWLSFSHNTEFSSEDPEKVVQRINRMTEEANGFLKSAKFLFITFGTARVYRWKETGLIVSNCHKMPSACFTPELLTVEDIVTVWKRQLDNLHIRYPDLKVVFTISPVRHWKDGAHGNQISKSTLFLAVEELLRHPASLGYFPAYEIVMDDLRDYRYYGADMVHLSETASDYIWNVFSESYLDSGVMGVWKEVVKITKALQHRLKKDAPGSTVKFAERILQQIEFVASKVPEVDLERERTYFNGLLTGNGPSVI